MKHAWLYNDLFQALKGEPLSSGFSTNGFFNSASAVPHWKGLQRHRTRRWDWGVRIYVIRVGGVRLYVTSIHGVKVYVVTVGLHSIRIHCFRTHVSVNGVEIQNVKMHEVRIHGVRKYCVRLHNVRVNFAAIQSFIVHPCQNTRCTCTSACAVWCQKVRRVNACCPRYTVSELSLIHIWRCRR